MANFEIISEDLAKEFIKKDVINSFVKVNKAFKTGWFNQEERKYLLRSVLLEKLARCDK